MTAIIGSVECVPGWAVVTPPFLWLKQNRGQSTPHYNGMTWCRLE